MREIEVVPYNPSWPSMFEEESKLIKNSLGNTPEIFHIGSTSITGLSAKPIIDILVVVKNIKGIDQQSLLDLERIGYKNKALPNFMMIRDEIGNPLRYYFVKGHPERTHQIHLFENGNSEIQQLLAFRDWMRDHPKDLQDYEELKINLAQKHKSNSMSYCLAKDPFIKSIMNKIHINSPTKKTILPKKSK